MATPAKVYHDGTTTERIVRSVTSGRFKGALWVSIGGETWQVRVADTIEARAQEAAYETEGGWPVDLDTMRAKL